jgi:hypothetical protein
MLGTEVLLVFLGKLGVPFSAEVLPEMHIEIVGIVL